MSTFLDGGLDCNVGSVTEDLQSFCGSTSLVRKNDYEHIPTFIMEKIVLPDSLPSCH